MKKYIIIVMMVLSLLAGCKKATVPVVLPSDNEIMSFTASLVPTKSHFNNPANPQLYWDASDMVAVYSVPLMDIFNEDRESAYIHNFNSIATIESIEDDGVSATLKTTVPKDSWFIDPVTPSNPQYDDYYIFFAYYPVLNGSCGTVKTEYRESDNETWYYIPFNVPREQDGLSYADYQVMFDPTGYSAGEMFVSKNAVMSEDAQISFNNLRPVTAMLRFSLQLPDGSASVYMESLEISVEGGASSSLAISGAAALNLLEDKGEGNEFMPTFESEESGDEYMTAEESGTSYSSILIDLDGMKVTTEAGNDIYAV